VQAIVRAHQGMVWVESEPGQGSTFGLRLPLKPAKILPSEVAQHAPHSCLLFPIDGAKRKILKERMS
ncbi:MAG TPA: hypothetical protein VN418_05985, partial [Gammaproteobacteria bacterium]|nr:hypothetical protein [Gammaproteobacteria bacterium]